jgi:hypothetical protein
MVEVLDGLAYRVRTPTPADIVAHVTALPAEEARALLVALLRARPDEAVGAVDGCKVARAWDDARRERLSERGGPPVVVTAWGGGEWVDWSYLDSDGDTIADGETTTADGAESAEAAADAALLADGWVLAKGVTP